MRIELVCIVCDWTCEHGRGHVSRMTAMKEEAARRGYECFAECFPWASWIGREEHSKATVVLVDDYERKHPDCFKVLARLGRVVLFDDWQPQRVTSDVSLVVSPGGSPEMYAASGVRALCGFKYAPIRDIIRSDRPNACGVDFHDGMLTHGGQTSLEAAYLGVRQQVKPLGLDVSCNVARLVRGERPDGRGAARVWDEIEKL